MADRNINQLIRKPRKTQGTPFYNQRNYYALGVLAIGGAFWILYELWPESKKLKKAIKDGKFDTSPETNERFLRTELAFKGAAYHHLMRRLAAREQERDDAEFREQAKEAPWYVKMFADRPPPEV